MYAYSWAYYYKYREEGFIEFQVILRAKSVSKTEFYTLWDGKIISKYHNEKCQSISMRPFLDDYYSPDNQKRVFEIFHSRGFLFTDLATQLQFIKSLSLLKPQG